MREKTIITVALFAIILSIAVPVTMTDTASAEHVNNSSWDNFYPMEYDSADNISDDFFIWDTHNSTSYDAISLDTFYAIDGQQSLGMQVPVWEPNSSSYKDLWGITANDTSNLNYSEGINMSVDFSPIASSAENATLVEHSFMATDAGPLQYDQESFFVTLAYVEQPYSGEQTFFENPRIFMSTGGPPNTSISCGQGFCEPQVVATNPFPTMEPDWGPDDNSYVENVSNIDIKADNNQVYVNLTDYGVDGWSSNNGINNTEPVSTWDNTVNITRWIESDDVDMWDFGVFSRYSTHDEVDGNGQSGASGYVVYDNVRVNEGENLTEPESPDPGEGDFEDPELSLSLGSNILDPGENTSYTVYHDADGDVTDEATVYSENINVATIDDVGHRVIATDEDQYTNESTYIVAEYDGYRADSSVFVGEPAPGNIGGGDPPGNESSGGINDQLQYSPVVALFVLLGSTTLQFVIITAVLNSTIAYIANAYAGLGTTVVMLLFGYAAGWVNLGLVMATLIFVILLGINLKDTRRTGGME